MCGNRGAGHPSHDTRGCGWTLADYDKAGNLNTLTYPSGRKLAYSYNAASRFTGVTFDSFNGTAVNYPYVSWQNHVAIGRPYQTVLGNNVIDVEAYNNRLQYKLGGTQQPNSTSYYRYKEYSYYDSNGHNNGNVLGIIDNDWNKTQGFAYDQLNRLVAAGTPDNAFQQTYSLDPWGNMSQTGLPSNWNWSPQNGFDGANHPMDPTWSGMWWDAAGNLMYDPTSSPHHSYNYNYEGQISIADPGAGQTTYTYDADGDRIEKNLNGSWTDYYYFGGNIIAELNSSTGWTDYIFANGRRIARATGSTVGGTTYYHQAHLGSARLETDSTGAVVAGSDCTYGPFGQLLSCNGIPDPSNHYLFTGKERDAETGADYFGARYYASLAGRWMSPDPRYFQTQMLLDPQQLNLYQYARNNPLLFVDPLGEALFVTGDKGWLIRNVLFGMAGGTDAFNQFFHVDGDGQVLLNDGVDTSGMNSGQRLIFDMVKSKDIYVYFAGTDGKAAASMFDGTLNKKGGLNAHGKDLASIFVCGGLHVSGCGTIVGTHGRPATLSPARMADGKEVFAVIAYNEHLQQTQVGTGAAGPLSVGGLGQTVQPASLYIHESAENLAFARQGNWDYDAAHGDAIRREAEIRRDLGISGGFAGGEIRSTIPDNH